MNAILEAEKEMLPLGAFQGRCDRIIPESHPKMKSNKLPFLLSIGLFLLPATALHAGLDAVLRLDVQGYFQAKESASNKAMTGKVGKVRLNAKQLLGLIGKEKGVKFPNGSMLMAADDGSVFVADSKRTFIVDASEFVQLVFKRDEQLFNGRMSLKSGKEDSTTYYPLALDLNLASIQGTLHGVGIEKRTIGEPKKTGVQFIRGRTQSDINGKGIINGGAGYCEGKIDLKGKTASPL